MIDKLLRPLVCDQIKALVEKIEANDFDARSLQKLKLFVSELDLTRLERFVVRRAYSRMKRLRDMDRIMEEIIIGQIQDNIDTDINAKLRAAMGSTVTNTALWNGQVPLDPREIYGHPEQSKRVVVRPRATTP
jgi:hypothetical protein